MKSKYEDLPNELHLECIAPCFKDNSPELSNLVLTRKRFYNLFQPKRLVDTLLCYVAYGNQDAAEKMLKKHPELMLEKSSVIDPSGRHIKNISAFELILWTMDVRYMANMVLKCIPKGEKGEKIRSELLKQYKAVVEDFDAQKITGGVHYTLNGKKHHEKHFDFLPLINALDTYVKHYDNWSFDMREKHWCTVVGKEQSMLPMHVRHHYCDPHESFAHTPTFDKKELKRSLIFSNYANSQKMVWDSKLIELGKDFGIAHAIRGWGGCRGVQNCDAADIDLAAMRSLCNMRTADLELLKKQLTQPIKKSEDIQESFRMML